MAVKPKSTFSQRLRDWLRLDDASSTPQPMTEIMDIEAQGLRSIRLPETIRDRYKVLRILGRGSFGIVLLARDLMIGRLISIKLLFHRRENQEIYQQFLQEARIAGQIEHPNIITIYDVHEDRRSACIIMEYLPGGNLGTILDLDGPLDEESALGYMVGIVDGLRAAHQMGVIHRDIKPPNILFDQNGNPVISDFGVAHLPLESGGKLSANSGSDEILRVVGTPEYMAPEQMVFGATIDGRADLYSAGLLFYEMLAGRRLFNFGRVRNIEEIARQVQKLNPSEIAEFPPEISPGVRDIIVKLIDKSPANRYPDARSLLTALETEREAMRSLAVAEPISLNSESATTRQEMYQDILRLFLVDGVISPPERRGLAKRAERLGVSLDIARDLEEEIRRELGLPLLHGLVEYESMAERLLSDRDFSESDKQALARLARQFNIPAREQRKIQDRVMLKFHMNES